MTKLYYTAPKDESFEDMKKSCIEVWKTMGNAGGYSDEKIGRIKDIGNIGDNFMYMLAMFDMGNQRNVISRLKEETKTELKERMIDGGNDDYYLISIGL